MTKEKFDEFLQRFIDLICNYNRVSQAILATGTYKNAVIAHRQREIIKTAREFLAAVDEREEDKDPLAPYATYVSDIIFHMDGTATIKYNGGSLGRVVEVFAKGTKYEKDTD